MEKVEQPILVKEDIENLIEKAKSRKEGSDEHSIVYSDLIGKGVLPPLELLDVEIPGIKSSYDFTEYTSNCAKMHQPDFGRIVVTIVPNESTIEMRSLRNYFIGYRNVDIFQEEVCANALIDIVRACNPKFCQVRGIFTPRGAMVTDAVVSYYEKRPE